MTGSAGRLRSRGPAPTLERLLARALHERVRLPAHLRAAAWRAVQAPLARLNLGEQHSQGGRHPAARAQGGWRGCSARARGQASLFVLL